MTCKYWDAGWCYAPEDVEHNSKGGKCIEPEYCSYLMENKTLMTEREHLECEIAELELEIKQEAKAIENFIDIIERKQQKLKEMNDSTNRLKEPNCVPKQYFSPVVIDENTIVIDGVEYKKVIPPTLHKTLLQKTEISPKVCWEICDVVRGWLTDHTVIESESAETVTFTIHKDQLQIPK